MYMYLQRCRVPQLWQERPHRESILQQGRKPRHLLERQRGEEQKICYHSWDFTQFSNAFHPSTGCLQKKARSAAQRDAFLTSKTITHSTMFVSPLQSREKSFYCVWCLILWSENCTCPKIRQWFGKTNCFCHTNKPLNHLWDSQRPILTHLFSESRSVLAMASARIQRWPGY